MIMIRLAPTATVLLICLPSLGVCQSPSSPAVVAPASDGGAAVTAVLDRVESADRALQDIQANLKYSVKQLLKANPDDPDDIEIKYGLIRFIKHPEPSRFFIHFEKSDDGTFVNRDKRQWIIFDGTWLTTVSEAGRSIRREQIVRPGEKTNVFDLGRGSFPLPFGQSKAEILEHFEVSLIPPTSTDPDSTDHLLCIPRPTSQIAQRYEKIELFISSSATDHRGLPVKLLAHNKKDITLETIIFDQLRANSGLNPTKQFEIPAEARNWDVEQIPLPPG